KGSSGSLVTRLDILAQRGDDAQADALLETAKNSSGEISEAESAMVQQRRAQQLLRQGKIEEARTVLADLAARYPDNLQLLQNLADLALDANDLTEAQKWEKRIHEIEGDSGTLWRYYHVRQLLLSKGASE